MSGLTSPAASSIALPMSAAPPSVNAPAASRADGFCQVMNDKQFKPRTMARQGDGDRQDDAATGKDLPETDKDVDPALAWLFGPPQLTLPPPAPAPLPTATGTAPAPLELAPDVAPDVLIATGVAEPTPAPVDPQGICDVDVARPRMFTLPDVVPTGQPDATPQPIKLPPIQPRMPDIATGAAAAPAPAAAVLPALLALSMTDRSDRDDKTVSSVTPLAALTQASTAMPIAPTADAQRQTLDMGRQDWPQKMIDHIEALRDNANANDTSIRLKPEALGRVDIALRTHTDGAISVRFTAEQPTTRTLLADATPQLSAVAEARGIRLSGTSVDLSGQSDQRPHAQAERARPIANRLAPSRGNDNQAVDDGRIA